MKIDHLVIGMTVLMLSFVSCTKDDFILMDKPQSGPFEITLTGEMGEFETITKSEVECYVRMKWNTTSDDAQKDIVWAYGYDSTTFKCLSPDGLKATSSEEDPYNATLSGRVHIPSDGNLYLIHYPSGTFRTPEISGSSLVFDMSTANQGADVPPFIIYSTVKVSPSELSDLTARFSFATSLVLVNLTGMSAEADLKAVSVSSVNKTCTLNFSDGDVTVAPAPETPAESDCCMLTRTLGGKVTSAGNASFFIGIPPLSSSIDRELTVFTDADDYVYDGVLPRNYDPSSYINTLCSLDKTSVLPGNFTVNSSGKEVKFTKGNLYYSTVDSQYHIEAEQNVTSGILGQSAYESAHVCHFFWSDTLNSMTSGCEPWTSKYSSVSGYMSDEFFCAEDYKMTVDGQDGLYVLTKDEWAYLFNTRENHSSLYKCNVSVTTSVGTVSNCVVIAPDGYTGTIAASYTAEEWIIAEASGLICLPSVGRRVGTKLSDYSSGFYWTATRNHNTWMTNISYNVNFDRSAVNPSSSNFCSVGYAIRMVSTVSK